MPLDQSLLPYRPQRWVKKFREQRFVNISEAIITVQLVSCLVVIITISSHVLSVSSMTFAGGSVANNIWSLHGTVREGKKNIISNNRRYQKRKLDLQVTMAYVMDDRCCISLPSRITQPQGSSVLQRRQRQRQRYVQQCFQHQQSYCDECDYDQLVSFRPNKERKRFNHIVTVLKPSRKICGFHSLLPLSLTGTVTNKKSTVTRVVKEVNNNYFNDERYDFAQKNNDDDDDETITKDGTKHTGKRRNYYYRNRPVDDYTMYTNRRLDDANHNPTIVTTPSLFSSSTSKNERDVQIRTVTSNSTLTQSSTKMTPVTERRVTNDTETTTIHFIQMNDLKKMLQYRTKTDNHNHNQQQKDEEITKWQERINSFSSQIQLHGGYVLLDLHDDDDDNGQQIFDFDKHNSTMVRNSKMNTIVDNLWKSVELFYTAYDYGYPLAMDMVRQITNRNTETTTTMNDTNNKNDDDDDDDKSHQSGGYKFLQVSYNQYPLEATTFTSTTASTNISDSVLVQQQLNPPNLINIMGVVGANSVLQALTLLTSIGRSISTILISTLVIDKILVPNTIVALINNTSIKKNSNMTSTTAMPTGQQQNELKDDSCYKVASNVVSNLLDNEPSIETINGKYSGTYHRLARYIAATTETNDMHTNRNTNNNINNNEDALRSHTDWTVVTLIPVSAIAGLEIYDPLLNGWIRPEEIAHQHYIENYYDRASKVSTLTEGNNNDRTPAWNSNYCVVMTGKFIEILSSGKIPSCIHRVTSKTTTTTTTRNQMNANQRLSVPLFIRPKESVFTILDQLRYNTIDGTVKQKQAIDGQQVLLLKGNHNNNLNDNLYTIQSLRKAVLDFIGI